MKILLEIRLTGTGNWYIEKKASTYIWKISIWVEILNKGFDRAKSPLPNPISHEIVQYSRF